MAVLVPDNRQLQLQGGGAGIGARVQAPPPMPTDILNTQQKDNDTLDKLGKVISDEAVRQQNLLNEAMVSDATTAAMKGFTESLTAQLDRKGYQVYSQMETDTTPARASAVDEFDNQTREIVTNAVPKFLNSVQRQQYLQWVGKTLPGLRDTVAKHQSQQIFEQSQASLSARIKTTSDTAITLADAGQIDNMQEPLKDIKSLVPALMRPRGASTESIVQATNEQLNTTIGTAINKLIADGRTVEAAELYSKYGTNLTGETAVSVRQAVQTGVDLEYVDTGVRSIINKAPKLADGSTDWNWVNAKVMQQFSTLEHTVRTQGATAGAGDYGSMANALTGIIGYVETTGGATADSLGAWQMDSSNKQDATDIYNKEHGTSLSPGDIDWTDFSQNGVAWQAVEGLLRSRLQEYKGDYEAVAIGWNGGKSWGDDYHSVPAGQRETWLNDHSAFKRYLYDEYKFYYYAKQHPEWQQALNGGNEATVTTTTVYGASPRLQAAALRKVEYYKQQEMGLRADRKNNFVTNTLNSGKKFGSMTEAVNYATASGFTGQEAIDVGRVIFQPTAISRSDTAYQRSEIAYQRGEQSYQERIQAKRVAAEQNAITEKIFAEALRNPNISKTEIVTMADGKLPAKIVYGIIDSVAGGKGTWASSYNMAVLNQTIEQAGLEDDSIVKAHLYEQLTAQDAEKVRTSGQHLNADEIRATSLAYLRQKNVSSSPFANNPITGEYNRYTSNGFTYNSSAFGYGTYSDGYNDYSYQEGTQGALVSGSSGSEWGD